MVGILINISRRNHSSSGRSVAAASPHLFIYLSARANYPPFLWIAKKLLCLEGKSRNDITDIIDISRYIWRLAVKKFSPARYVLGAVLASCENQQKMPRESQDMMVVIIQINRKSTIKETSFMQLKCRSCFWMQLGLKYKTMRRQISIPTMLFPWQNSDSSRIQFRTITLVHRISRVGMETLASKKPGN